MAYNTNEERFVVKGSERITKDLQVNGCVYTNGMSVNTGNVNTLNVSELVADNLGVKNLIGNNIMEGRNHVVNNSILGMNTHSVVYWNSTANQFQTLPTPISDNTVLTGNVDGSLRWSIVSGGGNGNGSPVVVMNENYFTYILDYNVDNGWDNSTLYITTPNGNFFFDKYIYTPSSVFVEPTIVTMVFNNTNYTGNVTLSLQAPDAVTNAFLGSSSIASAMYRNGQPTSIGVNMSLPNSCITNAKYLYIDDASNAFYNCYQMTDCFLFNDNLIENKPLFYNPWNAITNAARMFYNCKNLNVNKCIIPQNAINISNMYWGCSKITSTEPIIIPDTVTDMSSTFQWVSNFNSPITIGNNVTYMNSTFFSCYNFNQPINIPNSVTSMTATFSGSKFNQPINIPNNVTSVRQMLSGTTFNQPINIPDSVTDMNITFQSCHRFNSPITIGNNVTYMSSTFNNCSNFNQPINIPESVIYLNEAFCNCIRFNSLVNISGNNIKELSGLFRNCYNYNQPFTIPSSVSYGSSNMFANCYNFNSPVIIGIDEKITSMSNMFANCYNFNQPINSPHNVVNYEYAFFNCHSFNQPINISNKAVYLSYMFRDCHNFNSPVNIPINAEFTYMSSMGWMFRNCYNFDQEINIPEKADGGMLSKMFEGCTTLASSLTPIHISHNIVLGNTSNSIYNALINNFTGIDWSGRILNDA